MQCVRIVLEHPAAGAANNAAVVDAVVQPNVPDAMPMNDLQDCPPSDSSKRGPKLVGTGDTGEAEGNGMLMEVIKSMVSGIF